MAVKNLFNRFCRLFTGHMLSGTNHKLVPVEKTKHTYNLSINISTRKSGKLLLSMLICTLCVIPVSCEINTPVYEDRQQDVTGTETSVAITEGTVSITVQETIPVKVTFPVCGVVKLSNQFDWLNIRSGPGTRYPMMGKLAPETVITITDEHNDFYIMDFLGFSAYVSKDYIEICFDTEPFSKELYAHAPRRMVVSFGEDKKEKEMPDNLVDLRTIDPTIKTDIIFATDRNFTGDIQYPINICMIQKDTALKLKKAQEIFQKDGYSILVYDAYRPYSVSVVLFNIIKNPIYIADPVANPSRHNRGAAVDISLIDSTGKEVEMPSAMHTLDSTANRSNKNMSPEARRNMDYMTEVMEQCGFLKYEYEWWHFNDENCYDYPVTDHYYTDFIFSNEKERNWS